MAVFEMPLWVERVYLASTIGAVVSMPIFQFSQEIMKHQVEIISFSSFKPGPVDRIYGIPVKVLESKQFT